MNQHYLAFFNDAYRCAVSQNEHFQYQQTWG